MSLEVVWLGHATVLIELDGERLLTDPVLRNRVGPLVRVSAPLGEDVAADVDAILLSHLHADHADPASLRRVGSTTNVIAPYGAGPWLRRRGFSRVRELRPGHELEAGPLRVAGVRATHDGRRHPLGASAEPLGFVVRGSRSVYFAGDTDIFDAMGELKGTIDLALLPVWGWGPRLGPGHLDPARAALAAALIAPRVAIPIHWGTFALPRALRGATPGDGPALEFGAQAAREAPGVEVRILQPGEGTSVA